MFTELNAGFEDQRLNDVAELVYSMLDFYGNVMNRSSKCFSFQPTDNADRKAQNEMIIRFAFRII
jgi:hypothetical protein